MYFHLLPSKLRRSESTGLDSIDVARSRARPTIASARSTASWTSSFIFTALTRSIRFAKLSGTPERLAVGLFQARAQLRDVLARLGRHALCPACPESRGSHAENRSSWRRRGPISGCAHYFRGRLDEAEVDISRRDRPSRQGRRLVRHLLPPHPPPHPLRPRRYPERTGRGRDGRSRSARPEWRPRDARLGATTGRPMPSPGPARPRRREILATRAVEYARPRSSTTHGHRASACSASSDSRRPTMPVPVTALEQSRTHRSCERYCLFEFVGPTYPAPRREPARPPLGRRRGRDRAGPSRRRPAARAASPASSAGATRTIARMPCASAAAPPSPSVRRGRPRCIWSGRSPRPRRSEPATTSPAPCSTPRASIPEKADDYRRRGQRLLDELGAVIPEAERLPS